jgi:hypothetical protein
MSGLALALLLALGSGNVWSHFIKQRRPHHQTM